MTSPPRLATNAGLIPVPFLTTRPSGPRLSLVTPLHAQVGRKLVDGVQNQTVARGHAALRDFPRPAGLAGRVHWYTQR